MPTLIATLGAANANSYVASVADATAILDSELYARTAWDNADEDTRTRALITAARMLDQALLWKGIRATSTQALEWPRVSFARYNGVKYGPHAMIAAFPSTFPYYLPRMQTLLAASLLERQASGQAPGQVTTKGTIKRMKAGSAEIEYKDGTETYVAGHSIPSEILMMAGPWGSSRATIVQVDMERV
jgi:hypothetical protein